MAVRIFIQADHPIRMAEKEVSDGEVSRIKKPAICAGCVGIGRGKNTLKAYSLTCSVVWYLNVGTTISTRRLVSRP